MYYMYIFNSKFVFKKWRNPLIEKKCIHNEMDLIARNLTFFPFLAKLCVKPWFSCQRNEFEVAAKL